jgi:ABC-2 type transport system permease protein
MPKVLVVALREYRAAVQSRAFLVSLVLMPVICAVSIGIQIMVVQVERGATHRHAVVDRTGQLRATLETALTRHNELEVIEARTGARTGPTFELVFVEPSSEAREEVLAQRLQLSRRITKGELAGIVEIGPEVFDIVPVGSPPDDRHDIRFQSEKVVERAFSAWATRVINDAVQERRLANEHVSADLVRRIQTPAPSRSLGPTKQDPRSGAIAEASDESRIAAFFLPGAVTVIMFMMVLLGSVPAMQGVVEEKQQRIVEVLLASLSPFELMLGKLLGVVGVTLTTSAIYLGGGALIASRYGVLGVLTPGLLAWFFLFTSLAVLVFGSLFMAIGAAASDMKETQSLQTPVTMLATLPMLLLTAVLDDPNGKVAVAGSFVPFSAPMLMTARLASPVVVPPWHPVVAVAVVVLTSLACVWAAGRIFRVGLLLQGKGVRLSDLVRWVVRG